MIKIEGVHGCILDLTRCDSLARKVLVTWSRALTLMSKYKCWTRLEETATL
ncbi:hypothetical protein CY34DRAFT_807376, partial [Suillus luteus UH-Slu-Lm8-n1]